MAGGSAGAIVTYVDDTGKTHKVTPDNPLPVAINVDTVIVDGGATETTLADVLAVLGDMLTEMQAQTALLTTIADNTAG